MSVWSQIPMKYKRRWLWVLAFAGTTVEKFPLNPGNTP